MAVCAAVPRELGESCTAGQSASRTCRAPRAEDKPSSGRRAGTDDGGGGVLGARIPAPPGGGGCVTRRWSTGHQGRAGQSATRPERCLKMP